MTQQFGLVFIETPCWDPDTFVQLAFRFGRENVV